MRRYSDGEVKGDPLLKPIQSSVLMPRVAARQRGGEVLCWLLPGPYVGTDLDFAKRKDNAMPEGSTLLETKCESTTRGLDVYGTESDQNAAHDSQSRMSIAPI